MKRIKKLDLATAKEIQRIISQYNDIDELKNDLGMFIAMKEEEASKSLNVRFDLDMMIRLNVFDPWELKVVKSNHIANLQELIDCNLDQLVGITDSVKHGLEWVRTFYDMSSFDEKRRQKTK